MDTIEWWAMLPFVLMLLCIAVLPLCIPLWWEQNRHKLYVSLMLSLPTSIYLIYMGMGQELTHQMLFEYVPFILLLLTLYIITGGIHVSGNLPARPYVTTTFLAIGYVLASVMGTTGAANIAASVGNTQAKRAAMSHTIFNVFGVVWALIHYGPADKRREVHLPAHKVKSNGMLKISRKYMVGEVEIERLFVEVMGNMPYGFLGSVNANVRSGAGCGRYLT